MDYRVTFTKLGRLKYISHLDLQRAVARMLVRSGLPIAYTEGFNPHPRLNIVLPLSVYQEGEREVFDFRLETDIEPAAVCEALSAATFPGMEIISAERIERKTAPQSALYRIELEGAAPESIINAISGKMIVTKRSKSGEKQVDISGAVELVSAAASERGTLLRVLLPASGSEYLNPAYVSGFLAPLARTTRIVRENINF